MATNLVQIESDSEIKQRLEAERARLRKIAGLDEPKHFHRPVERAFTADQRPHTTILFGGFTWKHEDLIRAVFQGCGYRCEKLPVPNVAAFQTGKEYGNNGQCNPTYFTVGNLVQYLQFLESEGIPRQKILENYVFFTAGSCGPCRFGMYEAEYRFALKNAGVDGFRVLLFKDSDGIKAASGEPGLTCTGEFWAQITEGDGNFHMFEFLEREGAQVMVEPIATWVAYLMYQAKAHAIAKWPVNRPYRNAEWYEVKKQFANYIGLRKKLWGIGFGEKMWNFLYHRTIKNLGS